MVPHLCAGLRQRQRRAGISPRRNRLRHLPEPALHRIDCGRGCRLRYRTLMPGWKHTVIRHRRLLRRALIQTVALLLPAGEPALDLDGAEREWRKKPSQRLQDYETRTSKETGSFQRKAELRTRSGSLTRQHVEEQPQGKQLVGSRCGRVCSTDPDTPPPSPCTSCFHSAMVPFTHPDEGWRVGEVPD